ncbi:MAG: septum site-determining protein MinC, partial [Eubacteriales bacterium]|nr:septum site-determining protein MinC [Eubacteriales bacterium]
GQGAWTPWQMFAAGIIGFISGFIFRKGLFNCNRAVLSVYGFVVTIVVYGGIMNFGSLVLTRVPINAASLAAFYAQGLPMDIIHALSTMVILWFAAEPMLNKLQHAKTKYSILV